jgi:3-oxoadipate enol-lactonase
MSQYRPGPVAYVDRGEGPPVVLLHAFPLNGSMWEAQAAALENSWRLVAPDLPGFGRSSHTPAQPDMRYYADTVGALLDKLGVETVALVGLSMGGYVAFECLRRFPQRVSALVLANTRPDADAEEARKSRYEAARRVSEEGVEVLAELQMERLLSGKTRERRPEIVSRVRAMILQSTPGGAVAALGAMRERVDSTPLLSRITVPTLVIGGEEDTISSPEVMAAMAEKIPTARHEVLAGAGHLSNLEAPDRFNSALEGFLSGA